MRIFLYSLRLLPVFFLIISPVVNAQSTLFSSTFETTISPWIVTGVSNPNTWIVGTCAGNGIAQPGMKAAYISSGGSVAGCGPTGTTHYGYANSASGSQAVIFSRNVVNSCFSSLQLNFDLQTGGSAQDFTEVVYSTDNGATWTAATIQMTGIATWQTFNVSLPAMLNNTTFRIGFRFTCDNATISGNPPAIDNVVLQGTGTDVTDPVVTCPASVDVYADASCNATVPDLPPSVTRSDNCTAASDLIVNQSPAIGSMISASGMATMTVIDQAGNQETCNINLIFIDTISPIVLCPGTQTAYADNNCSFAMTSMAGFATSTDNCTSSGSLVFSQTPVAGTPLSAGNQTITLHMEDLSGNIGSCSFTMNVLDTIRPVVTCPPYLSRTANALCAAIVGDLSTVPISVTDNCTTNPNLFGYSQIPSAITIFTDTISATITVSDEYGNMGQCQLFLVAADTIPPVPVCLSDTTVATTNPCNYLIPDLGAEYTVTDACTSTGFTFSQTPLAGSAASGITTVTTMITDAYGNSGYCYTTVHPTDATAPSITCPSNMTVNNGFNCFYTLADYTGMAVVTDNCSGYTLAQSPPATSVVSAGSNMITITVADAGNNEASCVFEVEILENIAPSIVCPQNITSCNPTVTYTAPNGTDNCLYIIAQTDNSGLTSGSVFPEGITTQTYTITDSSGNTASCSFTIEVPDIPGQASIAVDTIELCNAFTTPISADAATSGTGSWSVILGTALFGDASLNTTTVSGLSVGTNKLIWSVSTPSCGATHDTLIVIVWPVPTNAVTQDTMASCNADGAIIQGSFPSVGTGTWTNNSGIVFEDEHAAVTEISGLTGGGHMVIWTISSGICPASSDTLVIIMPNEAKINFPDTILCDNAFPLTLSGSAAAPGQNVIWSTLTGSAEFSDTYSNPTTIGTASYGLVQVIYWLTSPACGNSTDTLTVTVDECSGILADIPTLFTPNNDSKNDVFEIPHLAFTYPNCRVEIYNRWGGLVFESDGYNLPWNGTYKGEPVPMGTYYYHIELNDAAGTTQNGSISIIR